jgi:V/A-type H+-transporting ATPase subunit K
VLAVVVLAVFGSTALAAAEEPAAAPTITLGSGLLALAAAVALGFGALGTALAQARIGSAAAGAMAERPEIGGLMIVFLALPETMIILGFLAAFLLIGKIR